MVKLREWQEQSRKIARSEAAHKRMQAYGKMARLSSLGVAVIVIGGGSWLLAGSGVIEQHLQACADWGYGVTAKAGFRLENIYVHGRNRTPQESLREAIAMQRGDPILASSLEDMKERIEALSTVRNAEISRQLPGSLRIHLEERVPAAVWQYHGYKRLVDQDGVVLVHESTARYPGLLVTVGDGAPEKFTRLMAMLQTAPELLPRVRAAVWIGGRRWNVTLEAPALPAPPPPEPVVKGKGKAPPKPAAPIVNTQTILLPEEKPEIAWQQLAKMQQTWKLLQPKLKAVDLRVKGRVFLKMIPETNASAHSKGAKT